MSASFDGRLNASLPYLLQSLLRLIHSPTDRAPHQSPVEQDSPLKTRVRHFERSVIEATLREVDNNKEEAAVYLIYQNKHCIISSLGCERISKTPIRPLNSIIYIQKTYSFLLEALRELLSVIRQINSMESHYSIKLNLIIRLAVSRDQRLRNEGIRRFFPTGGSDE